MADAADVDFDAFVATRGQALLRFAYALTGGAEASEDLVQEALARCYLRWSRIHATGAEAYVRRAILNGYLSHRRRRAVFLVPISSEVGESVTDHAGRVDLRLTMWQALARLSPRQRAVLVLTYYEDLPDAEIAQVLGCSPNTVKGHRADALRALRASVGDRYHDEGIPGVHLRG